MNTEIDLSCALVIFGGTGDLTYRKLMPALLKYIPDRPLFGQGNDPKHHGHQVRQFLVGTGLE